MRHVHSLVPLLALALSVTPAHAYTYGPYGCELRWDQCFGDGGAQNKNFACDTNTGTEKLVGSFVPAWDIVDVTGLEIVINIAVGSAASLPAWWQLRNAGTCRFSSLTMNMTATAGNCPDWAMGFAAGGIGAYLIGALGPNTARIVMATAVPPDNYQALTGRAEYFAFNLFINHANTVGTGACAGCSTPACIVLTGVRMTTPLLATSRYLTGPSNLTDSDYVTWQGGAGVTTPLGSGCPAATPAKQRTWGAVKALYR